MILVVQCDQPPALENCLLHKGRVMHPTPKGIANCTISHPDSYRCRKLPKALKEWQAFNELKKKIDDFNETCPLLEMMSNNAMLERHWKRMEEVTGHTFDVESESFQLRNIMEAPILQFREDIEVSPINKANHSLAVMNKQTTTWLLACQLS